MKPECNILARLFIVLCCATSTGLQADENREKPREIGATTSALLDLQRSGAAAGKPQPISGEVASRSYQRYLAGFSQPLPEPKESAAAAAKPSASRSR